MESFLKHLSFWHNKTNDECVKMATSKQGINAPQALSNILERDFCRSINNELLQKVIKLK